jgi:hypothetical protein
MEIDADRFSATATLWCCGVTLHTQTHPCDADFEQQVFG